MFRHLDNCKRLRLPMVEQSDGCLPACFPAWAAFTSALEASGNPQGYQMQVERSVLGRSWRLRPCEEGLALSISQRHGLPELVGRVLAGRGIGPDDTPSFLSPRLRDWLPDPSHLHDLDRGGRAPGGCRAGAGAGGHRRRLRCRRCHLHRTPDPLPARPRGDGRVRDPRPDAGRLRPERAHSGQSSPLAAAA